MKIALKSFFDNVYFSTIFVKKWTNAFFLINFVAYRYSVSQKSNRFLKDF